MRRTQTFQFKRLRTFILLGGFLYFLQPAGAAGIEPQLGLKTSFYSIDETAPGGTKTNAASSYKFDVEPGLAFELDRSGSLFYVRGSYQSIDLSPPSGFSSITGNPISLLGGSAGVSLSSNPFTFAFSAKYGQVPLLELDSTQQFLALNKVTMPAVDADLTYKVIGFEGWSLRVGGGGEYDFSSSTSASGLSVSSGEGYDAHLSLEYRRKTRIETIFYYSSNSLTKTQGSQSSSEVGLCLRFSYLGLRGLNVPEDERE